MQLWEEKIMDREEGREEGREEQKLASALSYAKCLMQKQSLSADEAMDLLDIPLDMRDVIRIKLY